MPSRVQFLCDVCYDNEQHSEGTPCTIAFGTTAARTVILCNEHESELLKPLRDVVDEFGVRDPVAPPTEARQRRHYSPPDLETRRPLPDGVTEEIAQALADEGKCFIPGCEYVGDRERLAPHLRGKHQASLTMFGLSRKRGFQNVVDTGFRLASTGTTGDYRCPECGEHFLSPQARGSHRSRVHGVLGTSRQARENRAAHAS